MFACRKNLTTLQRRTIQRVSGVLCLTLIANVSGAGVSNPALNLFPALRGVIAHPSPGLAVALSALALLPIVLAVWIAASYLKAEPDEFVRMLVVRALLWGFAVTMAGDAILGVVSTLYPGGPLPISVLNADLFIISTGIAFRWLRWSYR
jgi:hypothetical protein